MSQGETPDDIPSNSDRRKFLKKAALSGGALAASAIQFPAIVKAASSPPETQQVPLISVGVDFGVTQVVDGNWGVHATVKKNLFAGSQD
jgi:acetamidase/formamidase